MEAQEMAWLVDFFSKPLPEQWLGLPDTIDRVWLHVGGDVDTETEQPMELLALVLAQHLTNSLLYFDRQSSAIDLLWELRTLLLWFIIEGPHVAVFARLPELDELQLIWVTVARLCRLLLEEPDVKQLLGVELGFDYFLKKYGAAI